MSDNFFSQYNQSDIQDLGNNAIKIIEILKNSYMGVIDENASLKDKLQSSSSIIFNACDDLIASINTIKSNTESIIKSDNPKKAVNLRKS